ncbi:hypothetical protein BH11PLA2_BH11PLA2_29840 [soil metagenome]
MTVLKNHTGRPLKFESVEELETQINLYFMDCDKHEDTRKWSHDEIGPGDDEKPACQNCWKSPRTRGCMLLGGHLKLPRPYTVTGLAVWLDTSRQTLLEYQGEVAGREKDPQFADTIRREKQKIENYGEEKLYDKDVPTNGVKFSLANNYGWADKSETHVKDLREDPAKALAAKAFGVDDQEEEGDTDADAPLAPDHAGPEADPSRTNPQALPGVLPGDISNDALPRSVRPAGIQLPG